MEIGFLDPSLAPILEKVEAGRRLDFEDGMALYHSHDLIGVGRLADRVRRGRHGRTAYYVYNQHINYTNVCRNRCRFCAFARDKAETGAYTYTLDDVRERLFSRIHEPIREVHMVGGVNPSLPFSYYIDLLKTVREIRPHAVIKAFTAVEIDHLAGISGLGLDAVLAALKAAGLGMIPGGGAEVLNDRVWSTLFPKKINSERWLAVMGAVHRAGLTANATLLYGHIETLEERVRHFIRLRELQDRTGGFSAFIPLAFHAENTQLSDLPPTTGFDDLKTVAVARLMLDNFDHIKAYWVMIGEKLAQVALSFGADDLDGTIVEEKITHMAGATSPKGLAREEMARLIACAGFTPVERDSFYRPVAAAPIETGGGS
ncbi:aminofutalosine synthase MqnE [Desulfococcus sp.]|uniref:aminofutalosine synthase MqnE n=1 Tax=Desulfococcus sp. TaxID=2025834 RepID=UPI0035946790